MKRHMQPADEPAMQQGCERARVHHQTGGFSIDGCVNVQVISFTYANRHTAEAAILCARRFARKSGIHFEDQYLFLAVKNGASRQENISTENPIDFLFVKYAGRASGVGKIDNDHGLIDEIECANAEVARDGNVVKRAINLQPRWQSRTPWNASQSKMRPAA